MFPVWAPWKIQFSLCKMLFLKTKVDGFSGQTPKDSIKKNVLQMSGLPINLYVCVCFRTSMVLRPCETCKWHGNDWGLSPLPIPLISWEEHENGLNPYRWCYEKNMKMVVYFPCRWYYEKNMKMVLILLYAMWLRDGRVGTTQIKCFFFSWEQFDICWATVVPYFLSHDDWGLEAIL